MLYPLRLIILSLLFVIQITPILAHSSSHSNAHPEPKDPIPFSTRAHWMRRANQALLDLHSPCPWAAFGSVIVNHSDTTVSELGREICIGINRNAELGNPTMHGEMAAIHNCSKILTDPEGEYKLSPHEAIQAFKQLSLYTNAEPCPMCASAIVWTDLASLTFGTSTYTLSQLGWSQIPIPASEVLHRARGAGVAANLVLVQNVLGNETDGFFAWQFNTGAECPVGCGRGPEGVCVVVNEEVDGEGVSERQREL